MSDHHAPTAASGSAPDARAAPFIAVPALEFLFRAEVEVDVPLLLGRTGEGERRMVPIRGGRVNGPALCGDILPGGADWQWVRADGSFVLEARYVVRSDDQALIEVENSGYRHGPPEVIAAMMAGQPVDPGRYYFRACPSFRTAAPRYAWLARTLAIATGARTRDRVVLDFYAVR